MVGKFLPSKYSPPLLHNDGTHRHRTVWFLFGQPLTCPQENVKNRLDLFETLTSDDVMDTVLIKKMSYFDKSQITMSKQSAHNSLK